MLHNTITIRVHLDDTTDENGALNPEDVFARVYGEGEFGTWLFLGPLPPTQTMDLRRSDGSRLPADLVVEIWTNNGGSPGVELQNVTFHSSCSQPLICANTFGGNTIAYFENDDQGRVNCTVPATVEYAVEIPFDLPDGEDSVEIIRATLFTNFTLPNVVDLGLTGQVIEAGETVTAEINVALDPRLDVTTFGGDFLIIARTPSGRSCTGTGTVTFDVPGREVGAITCPPIDSPASLPAGLPDRW